MATPRGRHWLKRVRLAGSGSLISGLGVVPALPVGLIRVRLEIPSTTKVAVNVKLRSSINVDY